MSTYKVLGQVNPGATTLTTLYTAPGQAVISTIIVCNQAASAGTYRIAIRPAGESIDPKHYLAYDVGISANDSTTITIGVTLGQTDVISVYASASTMSFQAYGSEV